MRKPTLRLRTVDPRALAAAVLAGLCLFDIALLAGPVVVGVLTAIAVLVTVTLVDRLRARHRVALAAPAPPIEAQVEKVEPAEQVEPVVEPAPVPEAPEPVRIDAAELDELTALDVGLTRLRWEIVANWTHLQGSAGSWPVGADGLVDVQWQAMRDAIARRDETRAATIADAYARHDPLRRLNAVRHLLAGAIGPASTRPVGEEAAPPAEAEAGPHVTAALAAHDAACGAAAEMARAVTASLGPHAERHEGMVPAQGGGDVDPPPPAEAAPPTAQDAAAEADLPTAEAGADGVEAGSDQVSTEESVTA